MPWGNMYEFTLAGTFGVSLMYLVLMKRYHLRWMGVLVTGFLVVVLMLDQLVLYQDAGPLVPALHSYWLAIHVLAAIIASGRVRRRRAGARCCSWSRTVPYRRGTLRPRGYLSRLPAPEALERVAYRLNAFGFPIWTFAALVAGPIWAEYAWGSYWNWDPKEVWAFITWVIYAAYLHARATAGLEGQGRRPSSRWSASRRCCSTSSGSTTSSAAAACTPTPAEPAPPSRSFVAGRDGVGAG